MKQQNQYRRLIHTLLEEMPQYQYPVFPYTQERQWRLLRSLMNVRPPRPVTEEFLQVQDACLQEMTREKGITDAESLNACTVGTPIINTNRRSISRLTIRFMQFSISHFGVEVAPQIPTVVMSCSHSGRISSGPSIR